MIRVSTNVREVTRRLQAIRAALTPARQDSILKKVAFVWHARMVLRTPKRWTGATRRAWRVVPHAAGGRTGYRVHNDSAVMRFLERGTRAHGPVRAKRLFIPLTRRAAQAGPRGVMRANRQVSLNYALGVSTRQAPAFRLGRDYLLVKRVKGVKAMRIVERALPQMRRTTVMAQTQFLRAILRA